LVAKLVCILCDVDNSAAMNVTSLTSFIQRAFGSCYKVHIAISNDNYTLLTRAG